MSGTPNIAFRPFILLFPPGLPVHLFIFSYHFVRAACTYTDDLYLATFWEHITCGPARTDTSGQCDTDGGICLDIVGDRAALFGFLEPLGLGFWTDAFKICIYLHVYFLEASSFLK